MVSWLFINKSVTFCPGRAQGKQKKDDSGVEAYEDAILLFLNTMIPNRNPGNTRPQSSQVAESLWTELN